MLQKELITIPINSGIDTKRDEYLTDADAFLIQENSRFQKTGAITKRPGLDGANEGLSTPIGVGYLPKVLISDSKQLFISGQAGAGNTYAYNGTKWQTVGSTVKQTNTTAAQISLIDGFGGDPYSNRSWVDYSGGLYVVTATQVNYSAGAELLNQPSITRYDGDTQTTIQPDYNLQPGESVFGARTHFTTAGGDRYISTAGYADGASDNLVVIHYDENLEEVGNTQTAITAGSNKEAPSCATFDKSKVCIVGESGTNLLFYESAPLGTDTTKTIAPTNAVNLIGDIIHDGTHYYVIYSVQATNQLCIVKYLFSTNTLVWQTVQNFSATTMIGTVNMGLALRGTDVIASFSYTSGTTGIRYLVALKANKTTGAFTEIYRSQHIAPQARPYVYNESVFIPVCNNSADGIAAINTLGLLKIEQENTSGAVASFIGSALYDRTTYSAYIGGLVEIASGDIAFSCLELLRTDVIDAAGTSALVSRVNLMSASVVNSDKQYGSVCNLGTTLAHYTANATFMDGAIQDNISFPFKPLIFISAAATGGSIAAGVYQYGMYFEKTDSFGNVSRSEISAIAQQTNTGGTSTNTVTGYVSAWNGTCTAVLCRTTVNGANLQILAKKNVTPESGTVVFTDTFADSVLADAPFAYTVGGLLENTPCPPASHATIHQNRVWVVPADEKDKVYYSKKIIQGEMPGFSVFQFLQQSSTIPNVRDDIVGTGPVGDKLIILREGSCYWVAGDGVNELGVDSSLTEPELITQDIGCSEPKSIVPMPLGLMFKSSKGIYLIDTGLGVKYIGDRVEQYNSEEIVDATLLPEKNTVLFATASRVMAYDYLFDRWSVDTLTSIQSLAGWKNKLVALKSSGLVAVEGINYQDSFSSATDISMKVGTGWIKLSGIQNFGRIYRLLILGRYYSEHTLTCKVYYDYSTDYSETYEITPDPLDGIYQFKIHLAKQKCESIKFELYDSGDGRSMDLTGLTMEVGVKRGTYKTPAVKQY